MTDKSGQLTITEAIEVLKDYRKGDFVDDYKLCEAIDTVVAELENPLPSDEQIEQYALENILDGVGIQPMINTKAWIAGARWMRGLIQERREK